MVLAANILMRSATVEEAMLSVVFMDLFVLLSALKFPFSLYFLSVDCRLIGGNKRGDCSILLPTSGGANTILFLLIERCSLGLGGMGDSPSLLPRCAMGVFVLAYSSVRVVCFTRSVIADLKSSDSVTANLVTEFLSNG